MNTVTPVELPFGIKIVAGVMFGNAAITSKLEQEFSAEPHQVDGNAVIAANAIESLLLSLVAEGVDINTPTYASAITTAVESISNHLDEIK